MPGRVIFKMGVIKRQGITNTISSYVGIVIGFVNLIIIQPQFLTKEELGLTRILYSFSILVAMFIPLGIGNAAIRYFPLFKDKENKHHGFFPFMNLFPLIGFVLSCIVIFIFRDFILNQYRTQSPLFLDYFNWVFPLIFFNGFISVFSIYCFANYKSTVPAFLNDVVVRILTILVVSVYFMKWVTLNQLVGLFVGVYAFQFLALFLYIVRFDKPGIKIDWRVIREKKMFELIRYGMLLWFANIASIGLKYFDSIMIGKYLPLSFVGIYTIAAFVPTVIEAPLNAIDKIASAKIAFAWADKDHTQIQAIYRKSSLYLFLLGGFLFLNINVNIHTLLQFLPSGYEAGEIVVYIISIGTLFNMATGLNASILFNSEKYKFGAFFLVLLAGIVLALQILLIPIFGITGAAIATCLASLVYNCMLFFSVWKFFGLQPFEKGNIRVLGSLLLCFSIGYFLPHLDNKFMDIFVRTGIVSVVYFLLIYFQNIVPEFHKYLPWEKKN